MYGSSLTKSPTKGDYTKLDMEKNRFMMQLQQVIDSPVEVSTPLASQHPPQQSQEYYLLLKKYSLAQCLLKEQKRKTQHLTRDYEAKLKLQDEQIQWLRQQIRDKNQIIERASLYSTLNNQEAH